jgi:hypothetical protein
MDIVKLNLWISIVIPIKTSITLLPGPKHALIYLKTKIKSNQTF